MKFSVTNILLLVLFMSLFGFNVFLNISAKEAKNGIKQLSSQLISNREEYDIVLNEFIINMEFQLFAEEALNRTLCDSVLCGEDKVFLLFQDTGCKQCILKMLMDVNIFYKEIAKEKIIVIGDFNTNSELEEYLAEFNFGFQNYILRNLFDKNKLVFNDEPIVFVIDTDFNIRFLFRMKSSTSNKLINSYYKDILVNYFDN